MYIASPSTTGISHVSGCRTMHKASAVITSQDYPILVSSCAVFLPEPCLPTRTTKRLQWFHGLREAPSELGTLCLSSCISLKISTANSWHYEIEILSSFANLVRRNVVPDILSHWMRYDAPFWQFRPLCCLSISLAWWLALNTAHPASGTPSSLASLCACEWARQHNAQPWIAWNIARCSWSSSFFMYCEIL